MMNGMIIGIGEQIYDHVFKVTPNGVVYLNSRGGGSISNCLANLSVKGRKCSLISVCGDDVFGRNAIHELRNLSIDTTHAVKFKNLRTKVISEKYYPEGTNMNGSKHSFHATCLVCNSRDSNHQYARFLIGVEVFKEIASPIKAGIFDKISKHRNEMAHDLRKLNVTTFLDLGQLSNLRWMSATTILNSLRNYDVVFLSERVLRSIVTRADLESIESFIDLFDKVVLLESLGAIGIRVWAKSETGMIQSQVVPNPNIDPIVDDSGAGDYFFAELIDLYLDEEVSLNFSTLVRIVNQAQYALSPVLSSIGARGHMDQSGCGSTELSSYEGLLIPHIQVMTKDMPVCPFCGSTRNRVPKTSEKSRSVKYSVPTLIRRLSFLLDRHESIRSCLDVLRMPGSAYVLGTGGSYSAALFVSQVLSACGFVSQAIRPFDYIKTAVHTEYCILISYSGKTREFIDVIRRCRDVHVKRIILITRKKDSTISKELDNENDSVISYWNESRRDRNNVAERGFIPFAATLSPCVLFLSAYSRLRDQPIPIDIFNQLTSAVTISNSFAAELSNCTKMVVIGGGFSWPAMTDVEYKSSESGLWMTSISEFKDFSHGRFVTLIKKENVKSITGERLAYPVIIYAHHPITSYERSLIKYIQHLGDPIVVTTKYDGVIGGFDMLLKSQLLFLELGGEISKNGVQPAYISSRSLRFYKWDRSLHINIP